MDHVYCGRRIDGNAVVTRDGLPFDHGPSCKVWNHSPTGFEWGYGGSGPAQLALAILLDHCPEQEAVHYHQQFKWYMIAGLPVGEWVIHSSVALAWLQVTRDARDVQAYLRCVQPLNHKGGD